jgi:hypothetical protein
MQNLLALSLIFLHLNRKNYIPNRIERAFWFYERSFITTGLLEGIFLKNTN